MIFTLTIIFFILGLIIGSFLNVVILRLNTDRSFGGRSGCMTCQKKLTWYELIPVFSFLGLRGRCKNCKTKISIQYPLVELLTGIIFGTLFLKFQDVFFLDTLMFSFTYAFYVSVFSLLVVISIYDFRHKIIPDGLSFVLGIYLYPLMPNSMVSHWGLYGEPNGYSSKFVGLFLMPIVSFVMYLLFLFLPKIDPLKENIKKFKNYFDLFILTLIGFLFYIYLLTIFWNLGFQYNFVMFITLPFAILYYLIGILLEKTKRNWFVGIRTPWTLSSDIVWDKTHKLGSMLFKMMGGVVLLGLVFTEISFYLVVIPILLVSLFLSVYSYYIFRKNG